MIAALSRSAVAFEPSGLDGARRACLRVRHEQTLRSAREASSMLL